jgi:hypothetical protein
MEIMMITEMTIMEIMMIIIISGDKQGN